MDLLQGDRCQISIFGDDAQAIYSFRGAQPGSMQKFITDNSMQPQHVHKLMRNYRCELLPFSYDAPPRLSRLCSTCPHARSHTTPAESKAAQLSPIEHHGTAQRVQGSNNICAQDSCTCLQLPTTYHLLP